MKNIKMKIIALMLVVVMAFCGCAKQEFSIKINSDGSGQCTSFSSVDEEKLIDSMIKVYKVLGLSDQQIGTKEQMKEFYSEYYTKSGFQGVTVDEKKYYQKTVQNNSTKQNLSTDIVGTDGYVTTDTFYYNVNMKEIVMNSVKDQVETIAKQNGMTDVPDEEMLLKQAGVEFDSLITTVMTVEFPKKIVNTNGTIDKNNQNKVSFTIAASESKTLFATTNSKVTFAIAQAKYKADHTIKKPKIKKLKANTVSKKAKKATVTLKFRKVTGAKKYEVQYGTKTSFKGAKTKRIKKTTYKITKLKKNKKYYVRVRAMKETLGNYYVFSKWSKKAVKTKK